MLCSLCIEACKDSCHIKLYFTAENNQTQIDYKVPHVNCEWPPTHIHIADTFVCISTYTTRVCTRKPEIEHNVTTTVGLMRDFAKSPTDGSTLSINSEMKNS